MQHVFTIDSCEREQAIESCASLNSIEETYADANSLNLDSTTENTLSNGSSNDGTSTVHHQKKHQLMPESGEYMYRIMNQRQSQKQKEI